MSNPILTAREAELLYFEPMLQALREAEEREQQRRQERQQERERLAQENRDAYAMRRRLEQEAIDNLFKPRDA